MFQRLQRLVALARRLWHESADPQVAAPRRAQLPVPHVRAGGFDSCEVRRFRRYFGIERDRPPRMAP
jgi:hypothetical protein